MRQRRPLAFVIVPRAPHPTSPAYPPAWYTLCMIGRTSALPALCGARTGRERSGRSRDTCGCSALGFVRRTTSVRTEHNGFRVLPSTTGPHRTPPKMSSPPARMAETERRDRRCGGRVWEGPSRAMRCCARSRAETGQGIPPVPRRAPGACNRAAARRFFLTTQYVVGKWQPIVMKKATQRT